MARSTPTTALPRAAIPSGHSAHSALAAPRPMAAIYARVSTLDQEPENQLAELRQYTLARGWTAVEYCDHGISGGKERRPALDRVIRDARRRRFDVLVCWRLDRLGRSLKHLATLIDELQILACRSSASTKASMPRRPPVAYSSTFWRRWLNSSGVASLSGCRRD